MRHGRAREPLDTRMMERALREARKGHPSPNPHVGAVIARGESIVSTGHHARCGGPHAEIVALDRADRRARGSTLYVTVEPCNHQGRTGPCTEAIIAAGVARVVFGCEDPARHTTGGIARLRRAGIEVTVGVERARAERQIADFAKFVSARAPFVTLKAAVTLDGRIAARGGDSRWITSEAARREAHRMRARSDAVLVGIGTVLADDPDLGVRLVRGPEPLRVVLDAKLRLPLDAQLVRSAGRRRTLVVHGPRAPVARRRQLVEAGVELVSVPVDAHGRLRLHAVLRELARRDVVRLLVEGGATVHGSFLDHGLADHAAIFVAPRILGDADAIPLAAGRGHARIATAWLLASPTVRRLGDDLLVEGALTPGSRKARSRSR